MTIEAKRWPPRPCRERCVRSGLPFLLALLLLPAAALGAARPIADVGASLLDGVVVAPQQNVAFLMRPRGGVDAIDLRTGAVRWHSDSVAKPLALVGDRLIAQADSRGANALKLVAFDARSGAVGDAASLDLPNGVVGTVVDTPAGSFRAQVDHADSKLVVRWQASANAGGTAQGYLPAESESLAPDVKSGAAFVDASAAQLRMEAASEIVATSAGAATRPVLQELRTPLAPGDGQQWLSADGRHVLVSERTPATRFAVERYRWTIYERQSGARLGSVPAVVAAMPFVVVGKTLYHGTPSYATQRGGKLVQQATALRAVDLKSGATRWNAPVLDTAFRGPFPP